MSKLIFSSDLQVTLVTARPWHAFWKIFVCLHRTGRCLEYVLRLIFWGGWGPGDWKFSKSHLDQWSMIYFPVVGGFQHVLFSIIYGNNPSHWLSYFSRWLKTTNQLFSIFLFFFCGFYPFLQSIALKVIIAWTKFLVMSCETWLGNPGSMAGEWNGHCSMGNERYERQTMFDYHEAKPQKDTKKNGVETSGAR